MANREPPSLYGSAANPLTTGQHRWWELEAAETHSGVQSVVATIDEGDRTRLSRNLSFASAYCNLPLTGLGRYRRVSAQPLFGHGEPGDAILQFNVIKSCTDTASAKIAHNKPRPKFDTTDADWDASNRARLLQGYLDGVFYEGKAYPAAQRAFVDACIFGSGVVGLSWDEDQEGRPRLLFERVLPDEILVDIADGRDQSPRQLHRRHYIDRDRLIELFPKSRDLIEACAPADVDLTSLSTVSDVVEVIESWHLPSGAKAKDGRWAITIQNATLQCLKYEANYFPFVFFHWTEPLVGFWGDGLAKELARLQLTINRVASAIERNLQLSTLRIFLDNGSKVNVAHLNSIPGGVVRYTGRPPTFDANRANNPEAYAWLDTLIRRAYEITGISQLSATAQKPSGLDSGAAIREYNDTASERFLRTSQRWEDLFIDMGRVAIDMSRRRYRAGDKDLSVKGREGKYISRIKWQDVDLDDDSFTMVLEPASIMPTTPAGKLQTATELLKNSAIPPQLVLELLDIADIQKVRRQDPATQAREDIEWTVSQIVNHGRPMHADELTDLNMALSMGTSAALEAKRRNVPEERQELLRRWLDEVRAMRDAATAPPANDGSAPPAGPPPGPQNSPEPEPVDPTLVSDPSAKRNLVPMAGSGPAGASFDALGSGGQLDVLGSLKAHSDFATRFARSPGSGPVSDSDAKSDVAPLPERAAPAQMMDRIGGGKTFHYKEGVPGEDPADQKFGTTTSDLKASPMGSSMVTTDPETGYEAIDVKEAIGPVLASLGNLNERTRQLEAENDSLRKKA